MTTPMALENPGWRDDVLDHIETLCRQGRRFTNADLREWAARTGVGEPVHPNQWGGVMLTAKARGLVVKVDYRGSTTKSRHGGSTYTWAPNPETYRPEAA